MAPRTRTLTVNLHDFTDENIDEGSVTVSLTNAEEAIPTPTEPGRQILPAPKDESIAAGTVTFNLIPTNQFKNRSPYTITWTGAGTITFDMPDMDTTLYDLLANAPIVPPVPTTLGSNPPDGTMAAIRSNVFVRYNPIWVADSAPSVYFPNRTLWIDTTGGMQVLKYRGASSWITIASQGGGGGGLNQSQVDARINAIVHQFARDSLSNLDSMGTSDLDDADHFYVADSSDSNNVDRMTYGSLRARIADDEVSDWAQEGNTDDIPLSKLGNAPSGGGAPADDSITPAMLQADAAQQKLAFRNRIGSVNGPGYVPFNRHTVTVGDGPVAGTVDRGFAESAYGSIDVATYEGSDGVTYTIRAVSAVAPHGIRVQITPRPPRTGDDSILNAGFIIAGQSHPFSDAFAVDDTFGAANATTFTFSGIAGLMPAVASTVEVSIGGSLDRYLDVLNTRDLADVQDTAPADDQVLQWNAANSRYEPTTLATGGGGGLTQAQVDARVLANVQDWAEASNTDRIPRNKLPIADSEVFISRSPAADVAATNDATDGSFGAWVDVVTLPAIAATEAGRLRIDGEVEFDASADARTGGGGSRIGAEIRIIKGTNTVLEDDPEYGPRNLSNGSSEFQSTNQLKDAGIYCYDVAATGDVYKLQARIATQESRAITVQCTTGSKLEAYRAASGSGAGAVGQSALSREQIVHLWRRATSTPAIPAGGTWDEGWVDIPTGWSDTPSGPAGSDPLYLATGKATESSGSWSLSDWSVALSETFNTRYSDSLDGQNPYFDARASSVAFNTRLDNGAWSSFWVPIIQLPDWTYLGEVTLDTSNTGSAKIMSFPVPIDIYNMKDIRFELSLWQSAGTLIDFASSKDISPNLFGVEAHNSVTTSPHTNSILTVLLESDDGLRVMVGSGTSLPTSTETAGAKCYFRRNSASSAYGNAGSLYFYEWSRTGMRGYIRVRVR